MPAFSVENRLRLPNTFVSIAVAMGPVAGLGDKKRLGPATTLYGTVTLSFLSSRAKPRDLQFHGPFVEMFFDGRGAKAG
jgi:hypothetical protein